ncbi:MAG: four helix bundle protein [Gemmatimonadaceae bacterium]
MSDYKNLLVWQKGHALRSQIIRAAMSIPANIVEGRRQESEKDFARFLKYSLNSSYELDYHVLLARDIGVIHESEANSLTAENLEVTKMLHGLLRKLGVNKADASHSGSPV